MGSLEEARRTIEALVQEKDYYKYFWQAMNNYHSVLSRFQAPGQWLAKGPFTSHFPYSSFSAPVSQVTARASIFCVRISFVKWGDLLVSRPRSCIIINLDKNENRTHIRLNNPPSRLLPSPMSRHKPRIHCSQLLRLLPKSLSRLRHLPKENSTKSIESYFMSAKQHISRPANIDPASISDEPVQ